MWEQSSLSGSSPSSPRVMARRRLVRRLPRPEMADEEVRDEKYELILSSRDARSAERELECGVGFGAGAGAVDPLQGIGN